jgi:hypothetical protein
MTDDSDEAVKFVTEELARVAKQVSVDALVSGTVNRNVVVKWAAALNAAQEGAHSRMWC